MVNFRPSNGWDRFGSLGHPANFNGFRVLAALLNTLYYWASAKLCGVEQRAPPINRQGGHHVGHWATFLIVRCCWTCQRSGRRAMSRATTLRSTTRRSSRKRNASRSRTRSDCRSTSWWERNSRTSKWYDRPSTCWNWLTKPKLYWNSWSVIDFITRLVFKRCSRTFELTSTVLCYNLLHFRAIHVYTPIHSTPFVSCTLLFWLRYVNLQ